MVSIMMTPLNVHRQRAPQNAKLIHQEYKTWKFINAMKDAKTLNATLENEHNSMLFETADWIKFKVIQIAGYVARRISPLLETNQEVKQGDIIGLIKLGSQVTIIFDKNVEIVTQIWQTVTEGESVLGIRK